MVLNPYDCRIRCLWAKRKMFILVPMPHHFPVVTEFCDLGLRELGGRTRKRSCSNRIIPSSHFYKRSEAYSSQLPSIWRCWLAKRNWESKGSRHSKEKCSLDDSFPSLHSLKSFWQKRGKNKRSLHLRVKPGGFGLQPGKGMNDCPN